MGLCEFNRIYLIFLQRVLAPEDQPRLYIGGLNTCMRLSEITGPKTPDQLRMDTLRATQQRASNAVKMERNRQKVQSAQKAIQQLRAPKLTTLEPIKPMGSH